MARAAMARAAAMEAAAIAAGKGCSCCNGGTMAVAMVAAQAVVRGLRRGRRPRAAATRTEAKAGCQWRRPRG